MTTALGAATDKPFLRQWHGKTTAMFILDNLEEVMQKLKDEGMEATLKWVTGEAERLRKLAADIGTHQHNILEALLLDAPLPECPEHLVGVEIDRQVVDQDEISDGLLNLNEDMEPVYEMAECSWPLAVGRRTSR
ncbi:hypothetical protein [Actinomycetospora straminea]|uniref:Uncharacterized protein n=1 Tax=Actinomycetospora straminea TaxID=663607 RepID=A0ABP9F7X1_9PSEU|nr:hypothetical protein [Actinomycetospora straminea]MDD7936741.1 hypothetical protein [Actinomycetospora straminea]